MPSVGRTGVARRGPVELPYEVAGAGAGRLVFGHGLATSGAGVTTWLAPVVDAGWQVAAFDHRGHGGATPVTDPAALAPTELGADVLAVLDELAWPAAWLAGGSMGAATAMVAATLAPERVEGLVLVGPAFGRTPHHGIAAFAPVAAAYATGDRAAGEAAWRALVAPLDPSDELVDAQLAEHRRVPVAALACALDTIPRWALGDRVDALATLEVPVAIVAWEGDPIHPMAVAEELAAACPAATLHRVAADADLAALVVEVLGAR